MSSDATEQEQRDAVVMLAPASGGTGGCMGTLISPRLVFTAWHCVGTATRQRARAVFGQTFSSAPEDNVRAVACEAFPGARTDGVTPTCLNWPGRPLPDGGEGYTAALREPFDLAVVVLAERVDAPNRSDGPRARPMLPALDDPPGGPGAWIGEPARLVGQGFVSGTTGPIWRATTGQRPIFGLRFGDTGFRIEHGLADGHGEPGDSGGPWIWQPLGAEPRVVSVFNLDPRVADPEVRAWLRPLVAPVFEDEAFIGVVYVGPSDVPSTDNPLRAADPGHYGTVDPDGDGLVGVHDNCVDERNVDQRDANLDGIGDACDEDGDAVFDADDNCPLDPNPGQEDCDDDGVGDACTPDPDGDGVPEGCDNCPTTPNIEQAADCNADAVAALNRRRAELGLDLVAVRGDACDPIPCGDTRLPDVSVTRPTRTRITMDRVEVDARAETPVAFALRARTVFRYCQCRIGFFEDTNGDDVDDVFVQTQIVGNDPRSRELCEVAGNGGCSLDAIGEIQDPRDPTVAAELPPWRWTTHRALDPSPDGMPACPIPNVPRQPFCVDSGRVALAPEYPSAYERYRDGDGFIADRYGRWLLHDEDVPRWTAAGFGNPLRDAVGTGPGLRGAVSGLLWTHTPGSSTPSSPDYPFFTTPLVREQASHYWSGRALAPFEVPRPEPCFVPFLPFLGTDLSCPFCPDRFPQPAIGFRALFGCLPDLRFPGLFVGSARIDPGDALELPGLSLFAGDAGPWLAASESGTWLPREGLRYVKITSGAQIERVIVERAGVFEDPQACVPGQCNPPPLLASAATASPEPRRGGSRVLSARRGDLWVVGGEALADGRLLDDVWVYDLEGEAWRLLPPGARPILGRVHAATYSPADDALWVLDEVEPDLLDRRGRSTARLIRLDPTLGSGHVVTSWERHPRATHDRFVIAADEVGRLHVVGWRHGAAHHVVLRLRPRPDGVDVEGWAMAAGEPIDPTVRASDRGLGLYVRRGARVDAIGHRHEDLRPGGADRCF